MISKTFYYSPDPDETGSDTSSTDSGTGSSSSDASDSTSSTTDDSTSSGSDSGTGDSSSASTDTTASSDTDSGSPSSDTTDPAQPSSGGSSGDYDTDMQTIRDYVSAVVEAKAKMATVYLSAIDNFQTTVQSASKAEATPDILGVVIKSGLKSIEKEVVKAVKEATKADLAPLVDMVHAIYDEIDRAGKAAQSLSVGQWIKTVRTSVTNAFTQDKSGEALRKQLESEYKNNDEGGRGGYIGGIQLELEGIGTFQPPVEEVVEVAFYTAWINQYFNSDCIDGTGIIYLQFEDDGTAGKAIVTAPQGDKIAGALNDQMTAAGVDGLMALDVVKKVCQGDACMCFEGNNVVRKAVSDDTVQAFLSDEENWKLFKRFS